MELRRPAALASTLLAATLASAPIGGAAAGGPSCANSDTPAAKVSRQTMRTSVVCLINQQRTSRRLPTLHSSPLLDRSAQLWTNLMVTTAGFTHGVDFGARLTAVGYLWSSAGENIATGLHTPRQVVSAWMASTGHCRNILDPGYSDVGTGVNSHPLGRYGSSTWTQDFGLWLGHSAPARNTGPQRGCPDRV